MSPDLSSAGWRRADGLAGPVLVTGATGYVAGWIVRGLLEAGQVVHAAVREPGDPARTAALRELADRLPGSLRFFKSDLLEDGSYGEAMEGCGVVFHTASPFLLRFTDPQRELIEPALQGTRNVLASVERTPSVQRVVVTSSCAAVYGDNADVSRTRTGAFTEEDWNETSSLQHKPYSYSKVLAEKAAWESAGRQDRWSLVTINPSLVLGPGIQAVTTSGSFSLIRSLADGSLRRGVPDYGFGAVDVREVAEAHLRAGLDPTVASGRYILSGHDTSLPELAGILRSVAGPGYRIPSRTIPKALAWLFGPLVDKSVTRRLIARNVGIRAPFDHRKSVRELGITYRPLADSLVEMFQQMVEAGVFAQ